MCAGDDHNCPQFELHRQKLLEDLDAERRSFLKSAFVAAGGAAALTAGGASLIRPAIAQTAAARGGRPNHHYRPDRRGARRQTEPSLPASDGRHRPLGLFQQIAQATR